VWVAALFSCACAGAHAPPSIAVVAESPSLDGAVLARLAPLPSPPIAWNTPIRAASPDALAAVCAFEAENIGADVVEARCSRGTVARVGGSVDACTDARTEPRTTEVLSHCAMTVGDLVACRIAVRQAPCQTAGIGLRECDALRACLDVERRLLEGEIEILERIVERGGEITSGG
jgi:hypothetical protein